MSKDKTPFSTFQIRWRDKVGREECPYLIRWVVTIGGYAIRLHHWVASDDPRHYHDHAWWMVILVLKGGYTDISPDKVDELKVGSIRFRPAEHRHTVQVKPGGCWSLLITGQPVRKWGFYVPGRDVLLRPLRYFKKYGHHQCDP